MSALRCSIAVLISVILFSPQAAVPVEAQNPQNEAAAVVPVGGNWVGTTDQGYPVSFTVNSVGTTWTNFYLRISINYPAPCGGVLSLTVGGPGTINSNGFGWMWSDYRYMFSGKFSTATTATGTYDFFNYPNPYCGGSFSQSGTWSATLPPVPPAAFGKSDPANGESNFPLSGILFWNASSGASKYEYCFDMSDNNACNSAWVDSGGFTIDVIDGLNPSTTYYWQVRARNTYGITYADGGASAWWSFTTGVTPLAFGKTGPLNGAANQPLDTALSWESSPDASGYEYCVDTIDDDYCSTSWTDAGSDTSVDPPGTFLPGKTYYWQVRGSNSIGPTYADGGIWWSFSTIPPLQLTYRSSGVQDGWVLESSETSGTGGTMNANQPTFYLGDDANRKQYRAILSFNTASIPDGAIITSVTLKIKKAGLSPSNPFSTLGNIIVDIKKGSFGASALQLTDFQASTSKNGVLSLKNTPVNGWYSKSLGAANLGYVNKAGITQFRLHFAKDDDNDKVADFLKLYSGNALTPSYRPTLIVQYYLP